MAMPAEKATCIKELMLLFTSPTPLMLHSICLLCAQGRGMLPAYMSFLPTPCATLTCSAHESLKDGFA
eukprot:871099-Pelagomonas_calceolata.AAC.17